MDANLEIQTCRKYQKCFQIQLHPSNRITGRFRIEYIMTMIRENMVFVPLAEALLHQRRNGHGAHLEVARQEVVREHKQGKHRADFPCNRAHIGDPALAVQTDKLLCGQVGQQQGACNNHAGKTAARQKVTLCGLQIIALGLNTGNNGDERCEEQERNSRPCQ